VLVGVALVLFGISTLVRLQLASTGLHPEAKVWPNTFVQLGSIAVGILCALLLPDEWKIGKSVRVALFALGISAWIACGYFRPVYYTPRFMALGFPILTLGALAIFLSVYGISVRGRVLPYLGKISYGLYVFHIFAIYLVNLAMKNSTGTPLRLMIFFSGSVALTLALAMASYRWFEAPFLRLKRKFTFVQSRPV
jgi:peptidoglycan/LPS O-acetylase OafA/YrhL